MRRLFGSIIAFGLAAALALPAAHAAAPPPLNIDSDLRIPSEQREKTTFVPRADREVDVVVRLSAAPLATFAGTGFKQARAANQTSITRDMQIAHVRALSAAQSTLMAQAAPLGAREIARFQRALNGVAVRVKSSQINALKALPGVVSVRQINHYELDLADTVPYIGAKAVQDGGVTGEGITVAVLDSGIDYTHKNIGGPGTLAAYDAAYGASTTDPKNTTTDGLFPTAKVVAGYDFVGETWGIVNNAEVGTRTEDPDPIDLEGHGTHVADIIAGASADGTHKGVAPGAKLVGVKVCSAISSSCNGVALLKAVEFSLDIDQDGDISDAVDVINLSLGQSYGMKEDDLSYALAQAVGSGVVVVASAGNSADRPYIVGSPSSQPEVISVAQTSMPNGKTFPLVLTINGAQRIISNTNTVDWAPLGAGFSGPVVHIGRGCPGADIGPGVPDDAYRASPSGKVALIDRGACSISAKVDRAARAGAVAVILANNAGGDPPTFSLGTGSQFVPTIIITQNDGNVIKAALAANATVNAAVSPAVAITLVGSMTASSSRGPSYSYNAIKPDIGAPGASISAIAGSGDEAEGFGGTSGAAPMVAGSVALVLSARPGLSPRDVKALLVNTADANIVTNPATAPGVLAPITRIGGGEVRVNKAVSAKTAVWAADDQNPSLSFGYRAITEDRTFGKRVTVRNYSNVARTYTITPKFRYANDAASGAVTPVAPASITVPANSSRSFRIELKVDAEKLPTWLLNGGSLGGTGSALQSVEFDGYVEVADASETVHVAWQIMPHKSTLPKVESRRVTLKAGEGSTTVSNGGVEDLYVEPFALTGISEKKDPGVFPGPGYNYTIIDLKAVGVRPGILDGDPVVQFGIATNGNYAHPAYPAEFDVYIDNNRDGEYDFVIYSRELGTFASSGQCAVYVVDLVAQVQFPAYFCDADLNSGNIILTAALADIGIANLDSEFSFSVFVYDNYFTGNLTDGLEYMTTRPLTPRYYGVMSSSDPVPAGGSDTLLVGEFTNGWTEPTQDSGVLLLYRDAPPGKESEIVLVK